MSYMDHTAFAPAGGIQELSFDEIDAVNGGIIPMIYVAYVSIGVASTALAAGTAWVAGVQMGYGANRDTARTTE